MARAAAPASCWNTIARTSAPNGPCGSRGGCWSGPARATSSAITGSRAATSRVAAARDARAMRAGTVSGTLRVVVEVVPARVEWLEALAGGDDVFTRRFGIAVEPGWAVFPEAAPAAFDGARRRSEDPWSTPLSSTRTVRSSASAASRVRRSTASSRSATRSPHRCQGRGIATAVVDVLVGRARDAGVRTVIATPSPRRARRAGPRRGVALGAVGARVTHYRALVSGGLDEALSLSTRSVRSSPSAPTSLSGADAWPTRRSRRSTSPGCCASCSHGSTAGSG